MRSQGQVRFIKISSRLQIAAASTAAFALLAWGGSMAVMGVLQYNAVSDKLALLEREAKVEKSENRLTAYRNDIKDVAADLEQRQDFLEQVTESVDLPAATHKDTVSDSRDEAAETVSKVSAALPEAAELVRIEERQLAYTERLTRYADRRAKLAEAAIRHYGLNPDQMLLSARFAQGGPLEVLTTSRDGSLDPRFERLGLSLARMYALEHILDTIPKVLPASAGSISSGFGYRRDPFTGRGAMHAGLDFKAGFGAPIHAAAKGRVTFMGRKSGYGNVIEVSHGNGLMTRYAHMSAFRATVGHEVAAGDVIGAIGSTGRSTGPHLHFEVRINGRAVNPRPFLETATNVLEKVN